MDVIITNSANLVTNREDTIHAQVKLCLQQEGSYVSFGELEQVANDSLLLLVSNGLKRMIIYSNGKSVASQMKQYMGIQFKDSSLRTLTGKYIASALPRENALAG